MIIWNKLNLFFFTKDENSIYFISNSQIRDNNMNLKEYFDSIK